MGTVYDKRGRTIWLLGQRGEEVVGGLYHHFELCGDDPKKLADFYTKIFDWKITEMP